MRRGGCEPTILGRLAYGGMAEILLAAPGRLAEGGRPVVVKRILPHLREEEICVRLFVREACLGLSLRHPHIVRVDGLLFADTGPQLVMEYLSGADLRRLLGARPTAGRRLGLGEVAALGMAVGRALAHAHDPREGCGIVHQDVTPSNIMITGDGQVKLIDFGVATFSRGDTSLSPGSIKGKVAYMSPEQARGEPTDARSDQFSLALVLWECLAGESCYVQGSHFDALRTAALGEVRPLAHLCPDLPPAVLGALDRALQPQPEARFADVGELADALAPWAGDLVRLGVAAQQASRPARAMDHDEPAEAWCGLARSRGPGTSRRSAILARARLGRQA